MPGLMGIVWFFGVLWGSIILIGLYSTWIRYRYKHYYPVSELFQLSLGLQCLWPQSGGHFIAALWAKMCNDGLVLPVEGEKNKFHYVGKTIEVVDGFGKVEFYNLKKENGKSLIRFEDLISKSKSSVYHLKDCLEKELKTKYVYQHFCQTIDSQVKWQKVPLVLWSLGLLTLGVIQWVWSALPLFSFIAVMAALILVCIREARFVLGLKRSLLKSHGEAVRSQLNSVAYAQRKENVPTLLAWDLKVSTVHYKDFGFWDMNPATLLILSDFVEQNQDKVYSHSSAHSGSFAYGGSFEYGSNAFHNTNTNTNTNDTFETGGGIGGGGFHTGGSDLDASAGGGGNSCGSSCNSGGCGGGGD